MNGEFTASLVVARCRRTESGSLRWSIRLDTGLAPDITVAARMDEENSLDPDYYLLPAIDITPAQACCLRRTMGSAWTRIGSIRWTFFFGMAQRALRVAA